MPAQGGALAVPCGRAALLTWREPVAGGDRAGLCVPCQHGLVAPRSGLHYHREETEDIHQLRSGRQGRSEQYLHRIPPMSASSAAPPGLPSRCRCRVCRERTLLSMSWWSARASAADTSAHGCNFRSGIGDANHGAWKGLQPNDRGLQIIGASN